MADITREEFYLWDRLIRKIAYQTAREFPYVEPDDLRQTMWVALLERQKKVEVILLPTDKYAESTLRFVATRAAWKERRDHLTLSPQYGYRTKDIRVLFDSFFNRYDWLDATVPEDAKSELGPVQLELMGDLSRAFDRLDINHKRLLYRRHACHDVLSASEQKRLSKAYARVADILNTYQPAAPTRKVLTNAQAQYILDSEAGTSE